MRSSHHRHRDGAAFRHARGEFGREDVRGYGQQHQSSRGEVVNPFGDVGRAPAMQAWRNFASPFGAAFGVEPTGGRALRRYNAMNQNIAESDSPTAQFIRQAQQFLPSVFGQAQGVGQQIASMAPQTYELLKQQIGGALGALPGLQNAAAGQTQAAQQFLQEAQSPIASQAMYQDALRQSLDAARSGAAGRGMLDAGATQGLEDTMGRDLASQFAARRFGEQQQALGGVQSAMGAQAGLLPLGAQLAGMQGTALQNLLPLLQAGYQLPQQAIQDVYSQLAAFQNPALALAQMMGPQVAQRSSGGGYNVL